MSEIMNKNSGNAAVSECKTLSKPRGRPPGRPFAKGQSGNPRGCPVGTKERRKRIAEQLDKAFTRPDGSDELVLAILEGVRSADSTCLKLACSYRWGNPENFVQLYGEDGGPVQLNRPLTDAELTAIAAQALPAKTGQK
jgi:hypothetical protein